MTQSTIENMGWLKKFSLFRKSIGSRFIAGILLISILALILMISLHTYDVYRTQIREIHSQLDHITESILPGLTNSLWISDQEQVHLLLNAANHHSYIEYLELRSNEQGIIFKSGAQVSEHVLSREYDLSYVYNNQMLPLGTLIATASLDKVYDSLWSKAKTVIIEQGLIIFLISIVVLYFFNQLVTKHLIRMAAYARKLDIDRLDAGPLKLDRKFLGKSKDELEEMVSAFNQMMSSLAGSTEKLKKINKQLQEEIVEHRKTEKEKEKLEAHLRQSHKMEAIGTMAGGIAHDFNNILAIILGNADLALMDIPAGTPARNSVDQILKASNRARDLVKQILSFSRLDTSNKKPFYLCRLTEETMKTIQTITPSSVQITVNIPAKCRDNVTDCFMVNVDPTQIHQLLLNLCVNAVQAMDEKGSLKISVDEMTIIDDSPEKGYALAPGTYECLAISDTGPGIDQTIIDKIFDPFFTTKDVGEGTGMGLSVVHGIVEEHRGRIFVDSKPGAGTTFRVYFPVVQAEPEYEPEDLATLPRGNEHILFIDDEEAILDLAGHILEELGYTVTGKTSPVEALNEFQARPDSFDLVITDQTMPVLTGVELVREILAVRPDIPIIMCTGYSTRISKKTAKEIGIREFCLKPLDRRQMAEAVRKVLDDGKIG